MKFRLVEWQGDIFIVMGIGYNQKFDPPDVFFLIPLADSLIKSVLSNLSYIEVPFSEVKEITNEKRIKAIWILYGSK